MARHLSDPDHESSDEEDAPETISLAQSRKDIQKLDAEVKKAKVAIRQSKRRQNREVDRKLKERADVNRGGGGGGKKGDETGELEARMRPAMQEAEDEVDEEDENGSEGRDDSENSDNDDDEEEEEDVNSIEDEQGSEGDEEESETLSTKPSKKKTYTANHLPDELFTAAFASKASTSKRKASDDEKDNSHRQIRKKPKRSHTRKDLIVGSRAIHILPNPGQPIVPSVAPSSKVNKFLNRSLALKGGKQRSKTWERRPANIGVCRRDGPASSFVRNR